MAKLIINGAEILLLERDSDGKPQIKYSEFFIQLPNNKKIALLEAHGRTIEEDIKNFSNKYKMQNLIRQDDWTGKLSEPSPDLLIFWRDITKIIIGALRGDLKENDKGESLIEKISSITFKGV